MAYALQSMLKIRGLREERAQAELVQAKAVLAQAERELQARADARVEYETGKEERRDKVYAAVIGRTVKMDDLDRARSAVTLIDEEGILLAEAERKARAVFTEKESAAEAARGVLAMATRNKEKIVQERKNEAFNEVYSSFVEGLYSNLNEDLWNSLDFSSNPDVTTTNFFDVYNEYFK